MKYLQLIRYQNLLLLAFMQLVFRFGFMIFDNSTFALNIFQYGLLVLSTVLIAAAGYVINDLFDQESDRINKPDKVSIGKCISEKKATTIYLGLNIIAIIIGFYLAIVVDKALLASLFILVAVVLYLYSATLQSIMLVGNITVALTLAFSVIIIGVFDLYPIMNSNNHTQTAPLFSILIDFAVFAFLINFLREIVKDIEDVNGDYSQGLHTLPIVFGVKRASLAVFFFAFFPLILLIFYIKEYFLSKNLFLAALYTFAFVVVPLLYFIVKICSAKSKAHFHHLSTVLKWIIFFGIISIMVISYNTNLQNYA